MNDEAIADGRSGVARATLTTLVVGVIRLALAGLLLMTLLVGFAVWRLSQGELDLQPLRPVVEDLARRHLAADSVVIGSIAVGWDGKRRLLDIVARDIDFENVDAVGDVTIDSLAFGLDVKTLLFDQTAAPTYVSIDKPIAEVSLPAEELEAKDDGRDPLINLAVLHNVLRGGSATVPEMAALRTIDIKNGALSLAVEGQDRELRFEAIEVTVDLTLSEPVIDIEAELDQSAEPARLSVHASPADAASVMDLVISIAGLVPAEIEKIWPNEVLDDLDQPWSFEARTALNIGTDGSEPKIDPIDIEISADRPSTISTPSLAAPITLKAAELKALLAPTFDSIDIEKAHIQTDRIALNGTGKITWVDDVNADLELTGDSISYQDVLALWPLEAAPQGRDWVAENLLAGQARDVVFHIKGALGDLDALPSDAVIGEFAFEGVEVDYLSTLPNAVALTGRGTIHLDELRFVVDSGSTGDIAINHGEVVLSKLRVANVPNEVSVQLDMAVDLPGALRYLAREPLGVHLPNDVTPEMTSGEVTGQVDFRMPTVADLKVEDVEGTVDLQLESVEIPGIHKGFDVSSGSFKVHDDGNVTRLQGAANINDKPADVTLTYYEDKSQPNALRLESHLDPSDFAAFGIDTQEWIDGPLAVRLDVSNFDAPQFGVTLSADLTNATVKAPALGELKPAGVPGMFDLTAEVRHDQIRITKMALTGEALTASGNAVLGGEDFQLRRLVLDQLQAGKTDMSLSVRTMDDGSYTIDIRGNALDLSALMQRNQDDAGNGNGEAEQTGPPTIPPIVVNINLDELLLGGRPLPAVKAFFRRSVDGRTWATFIAKNPRGKKLEITLAPEDQKYRLIGNFDDLGGMIEVLGAEKRYVRGGTGTLDMVLREPPPAIAGSGSLRIKDFRLVNTPVIARIFALASLTGIGDLLRGKGLHFDDMEAKFSVNETELSLTKGRVAGSQVGATAKGTMQYEKKMLNIEGTLIPVRGLNSVLASIPIIGRVLAGKDGEGVFVATYSVSGPATDPTISVNPLSVIVPGIIRDIFGDAMSRGGERQPVPSGR